MRPSGGAAYPAGVRGSIWKGGWPAASVTLAQEVLTAAGLTGTVRVVSEAAVLAAGSGGGAVVPRAPQGPSCAGPGGERSERVRAASLSRRVSRMSSP